MAICWFKMMRGLIIGPFLLWAISSGGSFATETTTHSELLFERLKAGEVQQARSGFVSSLDIALTELRRVPTSLSIQDGSIARLAGRLQSAKWSLGWLVMGETYVRKNGGATPLLILIKILDAAQELHQRATTLSQIDQGLVDVEVRREILAALDHTGKVLLHTAVFLRGTPLEDKRAGVFAAARELVHVPYTFEEFDKKYNSLRSLDGAPFTTSGQRIHWGK